MLDSTPYAFSLELAALAGWRQYLNLEKWVSDRMARDSVQYVNSLLSFLEVRLSVSALLRLLCSANVACVCVCARARVCVCMCVGRS